MSIIARYSVFGPMNIDNTLIPHETYVVVLGQNSEHLEKILSTNGFSNLFVPFKLLFLKQSMATSNKPVKHWSLGLLQSMEDPQSIVKETKLVVVIKDKYPKAKIHYLMLPRENINSIYKMDQSHINLLEEFSELYEELKAVQNMNLIAGFHAVPSMQRLHMHIISTDMISPHLKTKVHWNSFNTKFFIPLRDVLKELRERGTIKKITPEVHKSLMATPLQCNQCSHKPNNMPQLKKHLLSHS